MGLFSNLFKKKVILSKKEIRELTENSSNLEIKKLLIGIGVDYHSAEKLCKKLTEATIEERTSLIILAKMVDIIYKEPGQAVKEFLRVMQLKKEFFSEGKNAEEVVTNYYLKQQVPWNNKERLHFFLTLFYVTCLEKGNDDANDVFSKLIQNNLNSIKNNQHQAQILRGNVKVRKD